MFARHLLRGAAVAALAACGAAAAADAESAEPAEPRSVVRGLLSGRAMSVELHDSHLLVFEHARSGRGNHRVRRWSTPIDNLEAPRIAFDRNAIVLTTEVAHHGLYRTTFRAAFHRGVLAVVAVEHQAIEAGVGGGPKAFWHGEMLDLRRSRVEVSGRIVDPRDAVAHERALAAFASGRPPAGAASFIVGLRKAAPIPVDRVDLRWTRLYHACVHLTAGLRLARLRDTECLR